MWQVKSAETYTNTEGLGPIGWEPFAVTQEPSGKYRVWAKREVPDQWHPDNTKFTPEAQKVQDEAKLAGTIVHVPFGLAPLDNNQIAALQKDRAETRTQAIKDVGKWASQNFQHWYRAALVTESNIDSLNDGKIPE